MSRQGNEGEREGNPADQPIHVHPEPVPGALVPVISRQRARELLLSRDSMTGTLVKLLETIAGRKRG